MFNAWMAVMPETGQATVVLVNANSALPLGVATGVFSRIPIGVANLLAGEEAPTGLSLSRFYLFFDLAVFANVAVQVAALTRLALRPRPILTSTARRIRYAAPLVWEVGVWMLILFALTAVLGIDWSATFASVPDLTLALATVATLWLLTGLVRIAKLVSPFVGRHVTAGTPRPGEIGAPVG
jgi:hypothetical protein